ncbi:prepilin-type N-terminal cleavage/methylation domain-containing protein [Glaciimonas sp. Gout2]|uniref:PulJ/GspJ family protein n=1 Tax=unclassified Glaciimonas TaxID=2644401 RepID=UPI002AB55336|nr:MULTISPECIES: prepilin-type N-terminal cleavage/methylation domain-containing protein [unclassified Glaciimonas]MDY7548311.1 prepilin-type N-terminal cleavage/methylation domain-containing protein [Glaciimonas sp. CA11.2]MEB0083511.1 prepilin-type N-terminal cleavage/methylation domain-containing protein [Glaciimonas sp. Gout2]
MGNRRVNGGNLAIKSCNPRSVARGFTLVELIIAITILALVAVLGWRGLDGIVRARVALTAEMEQTRAMQLTFAQLQNDCALLAPGSLLLARPTLLVAQNRFLLVRLVFSDQQPSHVQIVDYHLRNGVLTRQESVATRDLNALDAMWQTTLNDSSNDTDNLSPNTQMVVLQSNVATMQLRLWGSDGLGWRQPDSSGGASLDVRPGANRWTGLEVALQPRGRDSNMIKIFLLGAT